MTIGAKLVTRGSKASLQPTCLMAFDTTNPEAVAFARARAAELVSGVDTSTRKAIQDTITRAFTEQMTVKDTAKALLDVIDNPKRALTIARTETMRASNEGQKQLWQQNVEAGYLTGTEKQIWIVTDDDRLCPICEPLDGETAPLDGSFTEDGPPAHPNCRCTIGLRP